MSQYFVGIDSGTTGIKAVLFDLQGQELSQCGLPLTASCPTEDRYEEDPLEIWEKCQQCVKTVTSSVDRDGVIGMGITAQGDGLWLFDEGMNPVRPGICFCDGRAANIVERWESDGTVRRLFDITGTWLCVGNQNGIVKWMDENDPDALKQARWFMHLKDYLFWCLTGQITTDASDQSLVFLDQNSRAYLPETFELCGISQYAEKWPPVLTASENAFTIRPELAKALGVSNECVITSGPMDVAACALGAGVVEAGQCCSIMGTAALHEMVVDKPLDDTVQAGMTVAHAPKDRWLRLMASYAGAPNTDWAIRTLAGGLVMQAEQNEEDIFSIVEKELSEVPVGSNGVMYHPYLLSGGERAPFSAPHARASYTGISSRNTIADILHATYEGVALAMLDCYRHMPREIASVTLCGGGAKSAFWCQMFADALGQEVGRVHGNELGALGVVINNAVVQGFYPSYVDAVEAIVRPAGTYVPNAENHKRYERLYELYQVTYKALRESWSLRAELFGGQ